MLKRSVTIILFFLLIPCLLTAQVTVKKIEVKKKTVLTNPDYMPPVYNKLLKVQGTTALKGASIGLTTNYDYFCNSVVREQILYSTGVKLANMIRPYPNGIVSSVRHTIFTQLDSASLAPTYIDVFGGQSGFPMIDIGLTGDLKGTLGVVGHTPCRLGIFDGTSAFLVSPFAPNTDPSVVFAGSTIWLAQSGTEGTGRNDTHFFKSTDGTTFTDFDSISHFSPTPIFWNINGGVEPGLTKSPDETKVIYYGTNAGSANGSKNYDGISVDSCDNFWTVESTDGGSTWVGKTIEADGVIGLVAGQPNYAPIMANFGGVDVAVANNGVVHAVANGYGLVFNATHDTAVSNFFPVLYYNSTTGKWITISNPKIDTNQILGGAASATDPGYPTNSIGNAYPHLSVSADGKLIYVIWTGAQFTDDTYAKVDTASDLGLCYFWRDLYHTWSVDGGLTWAPVTVCSGDKSYSEAFGHAAKILRLDPVQNRYVADICYLADLNSGVSLFNGVATDDPIYYYQFTIPDMPTGINDGSQVVRSFSLEQNYPNPFNPSTKINYSLSEKSNVSLKVYDMLGREVANLINGSQEAGQHNVSFDASKLASGVYVYTLKSNSNVMSKKMMLMK